MGKGHLEFFLKLIQIWDWSCPFKILIMPEKHIKITLCAPQKRLPLLAWCWLCQQAVGCSHACFPAIMTILIKITKKYKHLTIIILWMLCYPQHKMILELEGACKPTIRMLLDYIESGLLEKILHLNSMFKCLRKFINMWIHLSLCGWLNVLSVQLIYEAVHWL